MTDDRHLPDRLFTVTTSEQAVTVLCGGTAMSRGVPRNVVLVGDVRQRLAELPAGSVDCVMTSPPYFNLRNYGQPGQIGLEQHVDGWVDDLRLSMAMVARVLKPTGSVWLNVADSYSRHPSYGAPPKSLLLGPERLALALLRGWLDNPQPCGMGEAKQHA